MMRFAAMVAGAAVALLFALPLAWAQGTAHDLRGVQFMMPEGWALTRSDDDRELDFLSADGRYQLWARWWFPDEPLLGHPDILRHEDRTIAGQESLFIHHETGAARMLELAFTQTDAAGEMFLWQLIGTDVPLSEHEALFEALVAKLVLEGNPAAAGGQAVPVTGPAPQPAAAAVGSFAAGQPALIFDGQDLRGLLPFAFDTARFETDAGLRDDAVVFTIPNGKGWANLGVATPVSVLTMPQPDTATAQRVTAVIDADQSTGITFALTPAEAATGDPAKVSDLRVQLRALGDGQGKIELIQRDPKLSHGATFLWPKGMTVLHLLLRPDQRMELRDGSGTQLAEFETSGAYAGRNWVLQTYLQVNNRNGAASLVLKRLSVDAVPFEAAPDPDPIAEGPRATVLFDGFALGRFWTKVSRDGSQVPKFISQRDGALRVRWAPEDRGSWTGIATPEAVLWLDRFSGAAEARVELALDGAASKDFEIALEDSYALPGNLSGNGSYVLRFTRQADGTFSVLSALRAKEKAGLEARGLPAIPDRVTLVLTPQGVLVEGTGMPQGVLPFDQLQDGVGLRIAIHARATAEKDGALVLRGVRIVHRPGDYPAPLALAPGLAPLPQTVLFDARPDAAWEQHSQGKAEFAALAQQRADGLTMTRRDPVAERDRIALVGKQPVVNLDYRADTTPHELTFTLDPVPQIGTRIFLHTNPANFQDAAKVVVTLRALTEGPQVGGLEVLLHSGHFSYDRWRRVIPARQWRNGWDGTVRLRLGPDWVALALGRDWLMRGDRQSREFMLAITPGGSARTDSGTVTLRRITGGWVTPPTMTGVERLRLSDTDDFDPDLFLDLLATETDDTKGTAP